MENENPVIFNQAVKLDKETAGRRRLEELNDQHIDEVDNLESIYIHNHSIRYSEIH
jgi:hypothetical protein